METSSRPAPVGVPDPDEALQFVIMLSAGLPPEQAILYFIETDQASDAVQTASRWLRSRNVQAAQKKVMGKSWTEMTLDEKVDYALNSHYSQLAYLLYSTNYLSVGSTDKAKLDTARQALEARKAGVAGKGDALSRFFDDLNSGKIKLAPQVKSASQLQ